MNRWKKRGRAKARARANSMIPWKKRTRNWLDLPVDILCMILMRLDAIEILTSVQFVCSSWYSICKQPHLWRVIHMINCRVRDIYFQQTNEDYQCMLTSALQRSCGQVVDITIYGFGTDPSLQYISLLSRQLRRICAGLFDISDEERLPEAESIELLSSSLNADNLTTVGLCCPLLKSLKLKKLFNVPSWYVIFRNRKSNQTLEQVEAGCDMEAFAIAETMPKLRYLEIVGSTLSDRGLHAILDACLELEYLDLTDCDNLTFRGQLRQKCALRIKTLKLPSGI